jgi:hypothetical protein
MTQPKGAKMTALTNRERLIAHYAIRLHAGAEVGADLEFSEFVIDCAEQTYLYLDAWVVPPSKVEVPIEFEEEVLRRLGRYLVDSPVNTVEHFVAALDHAVRAWYATHEQECPFFPGQPSVDPREDALSHAWKVAKSLQKQVDILEEGMRASLHALAAHRET